MKRKAPRFVPRELRLSPDAALAHVPPTPELTTVRKDTSGIDTVIAFRRWKSAIGMNRHLNAQTSDTFEPSVPYSARAVQSLVASAKDFRVPVTIYEEVLRGKLVRNDFEVGADRVWQRIADFEARGELPPELVQLKRERSKKKV